MTTPIPTPPVDSPYVGPRPFRLGERNFFGREREILDLRDMLIARRVVLLYSPSGAGKTSLIQAGMVPSLQQEGYRCLPVIRVGLELETPKPSESAAAAGGEPPPAPTRPNRYCLSTMASLEESLPAGQRLLPSSLAETSLQDYLALYLEKTSHKALEGELGQLLIFDQFEEVLTLDPTDIKEKEAFFEAVGNALRASPFLALFAMREDYVASLDPYLRYMPERLNVRFRIDLLGEKAALAAIQGPPRQQQPPVEFTDEAAGELVNDLRQTRLQMPDGTVRETPGPQVEPVQLQVVCQRLWQNRANPTQICMDDLRQLRTTDEQMLADLSDGVTQRPLTNVDLALGGYYAERVADIAEQHAIPERVIRNWFANALITPKGLRSMVMEQTGQSAGLDNTLIKALVDVYLVRSEKRRGLNVYELAHDRLIDPVRQNNTWWFKNKLSLLQRQADLWKQEGGPDHLLLRGPALAEQEVWVADHKAELTPIDEAFLSDSRKVRDDEQRELLAAQERARVAAEKAEIQRRANRRLRIFLVLVALLSVAAIAAGVLAYKFSGIAAQNLSRANIANTAAVAEQVKAAGAGTEAAYAVATADVAKQAAQLQQSTSAAKSTEIVNQQRLADAKSTEAAQSKLVAAAANADAKRNLDAAATAEWLARAAQATAISSQAEAEKNALDARRAFSSQLAIAALSALEQKSDLAPLLAAESYCSADTADARNALLTLLQADMQNQISLVPPPVDLSSPVHAVVFSPDGRFTAWGADDSPVFWRDNEADLVYSDSPEVRASGLRALDFSPDNRFLASGGVDGYLVLRDLPANEYKKSTKLNGIFLSLDIDPTGKKLAAALGNFAWVWNLDEMWNTLPEITGTPPIEHNDFIFSVAWDPKGERLATGSKDQTVRITNLTDNTILDMPKLHTRAVRVVAWSPDGKYLASAGDDGQIILWDALTGQPVGEPMLERNRRPLFELTFSSDGRLLASGGVNDEVIIWDVASRRQVAKEEEFFTDDITAMDFSPAKSGGRERLLVGSRSGQVALFTVAIEQTLIDRQLPKLADGYLIALSNVSDGGVQGLASGQTGTQVMVASPGDPTWQPVSPLFEPATAAAFSLNGTALALAPVPQAGETYARLFDTASYTETARLDFPLAGQQTSPLFGLAFDASGATLAGSQCVLEAASSDACVLNQNHLQFIRTPGGDGTHQNVDVGESQPRLLAYDPLGRYLASGGESPGVQIWQLSGDGQSLLKDAPFKELPADGRVTALAFSLDGRLLAVALDDWTLELWDMNRWQRLGFPQAGATAAITSLAFDPGGVWLVAATQDGAVQRWLVDPDLWAFQVCGLSKRSMTEKEWGLYFGSAPYDPANQACQHLVECKRK